VFADAVRIPRCHGGVTDGDSRQHRPCQQPPGTSFVQGPLHTDPGGDGARKPGRIRVAAERRFAAAVGRPVHSPRTHDRRSHHLLHRRARDRECRRGEARRPSRDQDADLLRNRDHDRTGPSDFWSPMPGHLGPA
jgi:hypothetical protein